MEFWLGVTYTLMTISLAMILAKGGMLIKIKMMVKELEVTKNAETLGE